MHWILALMVGILLFGVGLHLWILRHEREVFSAGIETQAQILEVRLDEGDCIVRYRFVEPLSGKAYERSGIAGFLMPVMPTEGDFIAVKYLARAPKWSRMVGEIKLASS